MCGRVRARSSPVAIATVVRHRDPASTTRLSLGTLDIRCPIDATTGDTAESVRADLFKEKWLGKLLPEAQRTAAPAYEKAPSSHVVRDGQLDAWDLMLWVSAQVTVMFDDAKKDEQRVNQLPPPARVLWFLLYFDGQVNNGGIESFLLQCAGWIIRGTREALQAVAATRLLELLESGIPLAARSAAMFTTEKGKGTGWWKSLAAPGRVSLSDLDGHGEEQSFFLLENELQPKVAEYCARHRATLIS